MPTIWATPLPASKMESLLLLVFYDVQDILSLAKYVFFFYYPEAPGLVRPGQVSRTLTET